MMHFIRNHVGRAAIVASRRAAATIVTARLAAAWAVVTAGVIGCVASASEMDTTWESPPVTTQLALDETIIPVGKGAILCPVMTQSENEPPFGVLKGSRTVADAPMGTRLVLPPGVYTNALGSGSVDQMIKKRVRVEEGATTLIKPSWSGLVIEVITEGRANVREYYEILDLTTGTSYGIGQGVVEGEDDRLRTWILPPGSYKLVKPGDNVNTVINFGTVRLLPGELVRMNLVVDSGDGSFIGFGLIADVRQGHRRRQRTWIARSELSGNVLLNYIPSSEDGTKNEASFTASVQSLTDARYESGRHVIPVWANFEEGLTMARDREVRKYSDKGELKVTYIYRLKEWLSPYVRGAAETRFFATHYRFENPTDYYEGNGAGDTLAVVRGARKIRLADPLSPVYLKRGAGVTSTLIKSVSVNLNVRGGYGARQTYARDAQVYNPDTRMLTPLHQVDITGLETLVLGDLRLGRYVLWSSEFDILMPASDRRSWVYDSDTRLRINITRAVNLLFQLEFRKHESLPRVQSRYQALLRFSTYL